jgi:hypothetical protein
LEPLFLFSIISFIAGFIISWAIRTVKIFHLKKEKKSTDGFLESEKLIKETLRKENALAFQMKESIESELGQKLKEAEKQIKIMDEDILLLQKSNEETEALLKLTQPEIYNLKIKLIESNNAISRLKGQLNSIQSEEKK